MLQEIEQAKYRTALCPYLMVGNRRVLVHLDVYGVPQSLQWPCPGSPDRLAWRDPFDEWPYWEELDPEAVCARLPFFVYDDGRRDYLHQAVKVESGYLDDTNILQGRFTLPGGAVVEFTTFVPPELDVWVRHFRVTGRGRLVLQGEFFEKAVRGHAFTHLGNVDFRGAFSAPPRGAYVLTSTLPLQQAHGRVEVPVAGAAEWMLCMCMADDVQAAAHLGAQAVQRGYDVLLDETAQADRGWLALARPPVSPHAFILKNYRRWLLSNLLLITRDGAMVCGPRPFWSFVWPRDGTLQSAAFAAAGYMSEARLTVKWMFDRMPASGVHEARYFSDGTPMLLDNRPRQGDNPGFLCWVAGDLCRRAWDRDWVESIRNNLCVMADHLVRDRDTRTGLPLPEADHRETQVAESIGVVVTAYGGLRGAAFIADRLGDAGRVQKYLARADEIKQAAEARLWHAGEEYFMTSINPAVTRSDIALAWGVHPFAVWPAGDPKCRPAIRRLVRERWNSEAGGVLSAAGTPYESFWQYHATNLLLGVAAAGEHAVEQEILASLADNISPQGMVPEQVGRATGNLWGCAPLPTAHASLLLYAYHDFNDGDV